MSMTIKDYEAIAAAINGQLETTAHNTPEDQAALCTHRATAYLIAANIADVCQRDNPRFDRQRFLKACGVTD